jgi:phosphoglycolate phosphatase-like HAD superfamily hydrolase
VPLLWRWRKEAVLVAGEDLLPNPNLRIDSSSYAIYVCRSLRWFLYKLKLDHTGLGFEPGGVGWIVKQADRMIEDSTVISGIPASWGQAWSEVKKEEQKAEPDPRVMCAHLVGTLESVRPLITFARLHQATYVLVVFVTHRRILWRTIFERVPIQIRLVEAMTLLMKSVSETEPDTRLVSEAAKLLEDHTDVSHLKDTCQKWKKMRDVVCENLETAFMLGFEDAL